MFSVQYSVYMRYNFSVLLCYSIKMRNRFEIDSIISTHCWTTCRLSPGPLNILLCVIMIAPNWQAIFEFRINVPMIRTNLSMENVWRAPCPPTNFNSKLNTATDFINSRQLPIVIFDFNSIVCEIIYVFPLLSIFFDWRVLIFIG